MQILEYETQTPKTYEQAMRLIADMAEQNEILEIAISQLIQFYTVAKYNKTFKMGWAQKKCQIIDKNLIAFCRARAIEIRTHQTNFGSVNSYPQTAWQDFLQSGLCKGE